jgi:plastocyanin
MKTKNHPGLDKNACLLLVLGLIIFSSISLPLSNNDRAAGFPVTPRHIIVEIDPGASDPNSQHPLNSSTVTVPVGSSVTWVNDDASTSTHYIISGDPIKGPSNIFYSPSLSVGDRLTIRFNSTGFYPYYDKIYPHIKGQVIVR